MRTPLILAVSLAFAGCTPVFTDRPTAEPSLAAGVGAPCAPALAPLRSADATIALLPHNIGGNFVFGLDGAFIGTASTYPLGASTRWRELDASGAVIRDLTTPGWGGPRQSPDGAQFAIRVRDPASTGYITSVRDTTAGPMRVLSARDTLTLDRWLDASRVLVGYRDEPNTYHVIDTRTLVDSIAFRPPSPRSPLDPDEYDIFSLSGDLRWAVMERYRDVGQNSLLVRTDLYDIARSSYVSTTMPAEGFSLAPRGDIVVWLESDKLMGMHLCDQRRVALADLPRPLPGTALSHQIVWSDDARYLSFAYGRTDDLTGPTRAIVADLANSAIAELEAPWGFVRSWAPAGDIAVLSRYGWHASLDKLARLTITPR